MSIFNPTLENRQYGGGYKCCNLCLITVRQDTLNELGLCKDSVRCKNDFIAGVKAGRIDKLTAEPVLEINHCLCGAEHDLENNECRDRAACAERMWRQQAKADDLVRERLTYPHRPPDWVNYLPHNEDCDYVNGWWQCPELCSASDPDYEHE